MSERIISRHHHGRTEIDVHPFSATGNGVPTGIELVCQLEPGEAGGRRKLSTVLLSMEAARALHIRINEILTRGGA